MTNRLWSTNVIIHESFLKISDEIYELKMDEMHIHWNRIRPTLVNRQDSIVFPAKARPHICQNGTTEAQLIGIRKFAISTIFPWFLAHGLGFFKHLDNLLRQVILFKSKWRNCIQRYLINQNVFSLYTWLES